MTEINYQPLSSVLSDIFLMVDPAVENEADLLEWAFIAFQKLQVRQTYEEKIAVLTVSDHKACLPSDTKYVEQMMYREDITVDDIPHIELVHGTSTSDTTKFLTFEASLEFFARNWYPIRAASSIFNKAVHCENSINLFINCEPTYSIGKARDITTSFENGYLAVGYLGYPMKDGEYLIPDDPDVMEAIKDYVLSRVWERRANYGVDGADTRWITYLKQFELRAAKARGKMLLLDLNQWQNFQDQMVRIGNHSQSYFSGFGNLSTPENIVFSHVF